MERHRSGRHLLAKLIEHDVTVHEPLDRRSQELGGPCGVLVSPAAATAITANAGVSARRTRSAQHISRRRGSGQRHARLRMRRANLDGILHALAPLARQPRSKARDALGLDVGVGGGAHKRVVEQRTRRLRRRRRRPD
ncbi:hypothetical protein H4S06_004991, partial [Coemansia sp. BCRC 34490]